ncbi:hypothetical protein NDU88_004728 [Pleurodeles waltl]|uniref:Uncharacterized protein n=1 Tax=Pleurodeles waltl TaxID=8319 RepID=A0AAV7W902_PLEWA|nr:hypothetical protein NDU88_004728 [Pleurodeles waltl]
MVSGRLAPVTGRNRHRQLWGSRGLLRRTTWKAGGALAYPASRAGLAAHEVRADLRGRGGPSGSRVRLGECPWSGPHYCTPEAPVAWSWGLVAALLAHLHGPLYFSFPVGPTRQLCRTMGARGR